MSYDNQYQLEMPPAWDGITHEVCCSCGDTFNIDDLIVYSPIGDCCLDCINADLIEVENQEGFEAKENLRQDTFNRHTAEGKRAIYILNNKC